MRREDAPRLARIGLRPDTQFFQRHALRIEHPEEVMIGLQQQGGGIGERLVRCEPGRIGVAMGADDRQACDRFVEIARDRPHTRIGREQAVGIEPQRLCHDAHPPLFHHLLSSNGSANARERQSR